MNIRLRFPRRKVIGYLAALGTSGALFGCQHAQSEPTRANQPRPSGTTPERAVERAIALWRDGREQAALEQIADAAQRPDWSQALCLMPMTEAQFTHRPQNERTALQQRMLEDLQVVRALARALQVEASRAEAAGDHEAAGKWRLALRHLGEANRGEHVPALVDLVGQAIVRLANEATDGTTAHPQRRHPIPLDSAPDP